MNRIKLSISGIIAVTVIVVVLQNTEPVQTSLLFFTFTLPRAVLLLGTFVAGFLVGLLWAKTKLP